MRRLLCACLLSLLVLPAFAQEVADLEARLAKTPPTAAGDWGRQTNLALAQLALKKIKLLDGGAYWGVTDTLRKRIVLQGLAALNRLEAKVPPEPAVGELNELAYFTGNDGTTQPYYLYLPPGYTTAKQWPLIIFLHGYVPSTSVLEPWIPTEEQCAVAGRQGCLLLVPYGRRNTDFQGVGETDVLETIELVRKQFAVDPDRLYLSGVSMGGMGAWNLALRHPGMFAAVTPMCGQTDMFKWWGWAREDAPPWKRWLVEWDNAADQTPNLRNQNIYVQHGGEDRLIPPEQSRIMVEAAKKAGVPLKYQEYAGQSHFIYFNIESYENAWSWQKQFTLDRSPKRVDFRVFSYEYDTAYWLTVSELERWLQPGEVTAEVSGGGKTLTLKTSGINELRLNAKQAKLREGFQYTWNGSRKQTAPVAKGDVVVLRAPNAPPSPDGLRKRRGLCGPCEEVFDTRFLLVQGTAGDDAADAALARQVGTWAKEWDEFADGLPPVKTDAEITPGDLGGSNLVLFGTPQTNSVLQKLAPQLPITIGDHRYEIGGTVYEGADLGLVMCYPNPLNPQRYVLIYAGERHGEKLSVNHKHDLLPDFLVFTTRSFGRDDTNDALCAGYFDNHWRLDPKLTWPSPGR